MAAIIEPFRSVTLSLSTFTECETDTLVFSTASCDVDDCSDQPSASNDGTMRVSADDTCQASDVMFEKLGAHWLGAYNSRSTSLVWSGMVLVKYARREIRKLTADDRERLLDAMHVRRPPCFVVVHALTQANKTHIRPYTRVCHHVISIPLFLPFTHMHAHHLQVLWAMSTPEGIKTYGAKYLGVDALVTVHANRAADISCDHLHDGTGFLMQHSGFSIAFERSLQAVDRLVALPYWDFTIEATALSMDDSLTLSDVSPMLSEMYFGSSNITGSSVIDSGRWAYTPALAASDEGGMAINAYGLLRAPWNNNGAPYVSRHVGDMCGAAPVSPRDVPDCSSHAELLGYKSWAEFSKGDGHGPIHLNTGGVFGCASVFPTLYAQFTDDELNTRWGYKTLSDIVIVRDQCQIPRPQVAHRKS